MTIEYPSSPASSYARAAAEPILRASYADVAAPPVAQRYEETGGAPASMLGRPLTAELVTPDRVGRYTHYAGSIYWTPGTDARLVRGAIRDRWASLRWEAGPLGFPTRGEHDVPGGRRSTFEGGSITWDRATGATTVLYDERP